MKACNAIVFMPMIALCSCAPAKMDFREGKDVYLDTASCERLSGNYENGSKSWNTLYGHFRDDTVYKELIVNIEPVGHDRLKLKVLNKGDAIDSLTIKGKYKAGYFKVKRQIEVDFLLVPILWSISEDTRFIGLTKDGRLVVFKSRGGGHMMFMLWPIFTAAGTATEDEYIRK